MSPEEIARRREVAVEAAQAAGLRGVWMNRFGRVAPETIVPDATCRNLPELEDWLCDTRAAADA